MNYYAIIMPVENTVLIDRPTAIMDCIWMILGNCIKSPLQIKT